MHLLRCTHFAGLYPALIASSSNMYLPFFVLPYQRDPCLWYMPDAVLTHTMPAVFVCAGGLAASVEERVVEAEEVGVGFAGDVLFAGAVVALGLSDPLD